MFDMDKVLWRAVRNHLERQSYAVSDDARIEVLGLAKSFYEEGASIDESVEWATDLVFRHGPLERAS